LKVASLAVCLVLALGACAGATAGTRSISVFAASSLQGVLPELANAYARTDAGVAITMAFDGSSRLRAQIELGAPADLFLSADEGNAVALAAAGRASGEPVPYAANRIVLVVPRDGSPVARWQDLATVGTRIVAAGDAVPITHYAELVVQQLAARPGAPPGFVQAYRRNVVSREDNVRAALAKVELGEADAALVYATDARASVRVMAVPLPPNSVTATYWGLALAGSARSVGAATFLAWLRSPVAQAILAAHGFSPPP
jgi:molybdate transport system substrate-binding protein